MAVFRFIPELPFSEGRFSTAIPFALASRVAINRAKARRQWVVRSTILLVVTGISMAAVLVWHQDTDVIAASTRAAQRSATAIQAHYAQTGLLPNELPVADPDDFAYVSYADRFYAQQASRPVIIAVSPALSLVLRSNGRSVIVYDNGRAYAQWMTETAFTRTWLAQTRDAERFEQERRSRPVELP